MDGGANSSITIVLSSQPADDVTVNLTPDSQLTLSSDSLTFTPDDWNVAQSVSVEAVFDASQTAEDNATITPSVSSNDSKYNGISMPDISVQVVPQLSISTPMPAPTATTQAATAITSTGATVNASVNPEGSATTVSFVYGTSSTLSSGTTTTSRQSIDDGSAAVPVTAALTGLTAGTTYYFEVVATNTGGATDGSILSFTTPTPDPNPSSHRDDTGGDSDHEHRGDPERER